MYTSKSKFIDSDDVHHKKKKSLKEPSKKRHKHKSLISSVSQSTKSQLSLLENDVDIPSIDETHKLSLSEENFPSIKKSIQDQHALFNFTVSHNQQTPMPMSPRKKKKHSHNEMIIPFVQNGTSQLSICENQSLDTVNNVEVLDIDKAPKLFLGKEKSASRKKTNQDHHALFDYAISHDEQILISEPSKKKKKKQKYNETVPSILPNEKSHLSIFENQSKSLNAINNVDVFDIDKTSELFLSNKNSLLRRENIQNQHVLLNSTDSQNQQTLISKPSRKKKKHKYNEIIPPFSQNEKLQLSMLEHQSKSLDADNDVVVLDIDETPELFLSNEKSQSRKKGCQDQVALFDSTVSQSQQTPISELPRKKKKHKYNKIIPLVSQNETLQLSLFENKSKSSDTVNDVEVFDIDKVPEVFLCKEKSSSRKKSIQDPHTLIDSIVLQNEQSSTCKKSMKKKHKDNEIISFVSESEKSGLPMLENQSKSLDSDNDVEILHIEKEPELFLDEERSTSRKKKIKNKHDQFDHSISSVIMSQDQLKFFGSVIPDVGQEFLDFDVPPLHEGESVSVLSKEKMQDFENRGIVIKAGKWSEKEEKKLRKNYDALITKYKINDPYFLFGIGQGRRSKDSLIFLKRTHFYVQLGKGLNNRTLRSIYIKAREMFHPNKDKSHANEKEISYIFERQRQLGNKWTKIGKDLERKGQNCGEIHRWHEKCIKKGKWSDEEVEMLLHALEKAAGTSNLSASQIENIPWSKVAELVPFRNFSQCRHYWAEHLAWDCDISERRKWNKSCFAKLVYLLKEYYYVKNETKIDWKKLQESFKNVSPSYIFLQKQWRYLKSRVQIGEMKSSYKQILDLLFEKYKHKIEKLSLNC